MTHLILMCIRSATRVVVNTIEVEAPPDSISDDVGNTYYLRCAIDGTQTWYTLNTPDELGHRPPLASRITLTWSAAGGTFSKSYMLEQDHA